MEFTYHAPAVPLRGLVGSYYILRSDIPVLHDRLRAEMANVRFILKGHGRVNRPGRYTRTYPEAALVGSGSVPCDVEVHGPAILLGASVTATGWKRLFGVDADELTDIVVDLAALVGDGIRAHVERMREALSDAARIDAADGLFLDLLARSRWQSPQLIESVDDWLLCAKSRTLDSLAQENAMSWRQLSRIVRAHYGMSPKRLQRKYRALHAALDMSRGICGVQNGFYDRPHMIREFHAFIGCTPREYAGGRSKLISVSVAKRLSIPGIPPLTLLS
ncbi:helix-turn-helix transcriptional regulator [Pacificimonas sp. WHA3]|uniref:Helix-turn-helix transcriptional regulator n=1 Tax=Pacificimonas pallii TaxID=2827236 RepID=A0ABS6SC53_9SPHN|nr:helix-turn-helix domain-containing protein [Pacificimonas pallii]MBV7255940.1 helix-turn-helix transcriptional regulator [Pacificimonas pallii]